LNRYIALMLISTAKERLIQPVRMTGSGTWQTAKMENALGPYHENALLSITAAMHPGVSGDRAAVGDQQIDVFCLPVVWVSN